MSRYLELNQCPLRLLRDGQYTFDLGKNAAGAYKVTFSKEGYIERSYDITVKKVESGLGENIQNA